MIAAPVRFNALRGELLLPGDAYIEGVPANSVWQGRGQSKTPISRWSWRTTLAPHMT
jgi:hypothetical protein